MLQKLGLKPGGCPDELNITNAEMVGKVHAAIKRPAVISLRQIPLAQTG